MYHIVVHIDGRDYTVKTQGVAAHARISAIRRGQHTISVTVTDVLVYAKTSANW